MTLNSCRFYGHGHWASCSQRAFLAYKIGQCRISRMYSSTTYTGKTKEHVSHKQSWTACRDLDKTDDVPPLTQQRLHMIGNLWCVHLDIELLSDQSYWSTKVGMNNMLQGKLWNPALLMLLLLYLKRDQENQMAPLQDNTKKLTFTKKTKEHVGHKQLWTACRDLDKTDDVPPIAQQRLHMVGNLWCVHLDIELLSDQSYWNTKVRMNNMLQKTCFVGVIIVLP